MAIEILLSTENIALAHVEAARRQSYNEAKGLKGRNRAPAKGEKAIQMHVLGCIGEIAVAKHLSLEDSLFTNESPVRGSADLSGRLEVKTRSKHGYDLLIQFSDDPSKTFVLVTYEGGSIAKIVGYIDGYSAMRKEWIREFVRGRPCYAVPQNQLKKIDTLGASLKSASSERVIDRVECSLIERDGRIFLELQGSTMSQLKWKENSCLKFAFVSESSQYLIGELSECNTKNG